METTFDLEKIKTQNIVIVDFWAEWCSPCRALHPVLTDIEESTDIGVVKINIDDNRDLAMEYGVRSIPTMIVFKDGEVFNRIVGYKPKDEILNEVYK